MRLVRWCSRLLSVMRSRGIEKYIYDALAIGGSYELMILESFKGGKLLFKIL
jgi:hypothetical protein